jgi:hypothetical protein
MSLHFPPQMNSFKFWHLVKAAPGKGEGKWEGERGEGREEGRGLTRSGGPQGL